MRFPIWSCRKRQEKANEEQINIYEENTPFESIEAVSIYKQASFTCTTVLHDRSLPERSVTE